MKVGDLVRLKSMKIPTEGVDNYLGIITEKMDEYGFIIYFFSADEYYGFDKCHLELVSE